VKKYILYIASENKIKEAKEDLERFVSSKKTKDHYTITLTTKENLDFSVYFVKKLEDVSTYLRSYPLDIILYDERDRNTSAKEALKIIRSEITLLSSTLGLDFHFSMQKVATIIGHHDETEKILFYLGRRNLKEVFVNPKKFFSSEENISTLLQYKKNSIKGDKIGFACGGGGLDGYLYSLGCILAINHALEKGKLEDCHYFSGISSGSIVSSILAKKLSVEENILALYGRSRLYKTFSARILYDFAGFEFFKRMMSYGFRKDTGESLKASERFLRSMPTGLFHGRKFVKYFEECLEAAGVENGFKKEFNNLFIGATDQDTFEHVVFGLEPWNHIKLSDAIRASSALVPLLAPWKIDGTSFIDGQITRSCNIDLLIRKGCNLIIIVDPVMPYSKEIIEGVDVQGGFYTVIQTIKALIYSRFKARLNHLHERHPDVSFILFQPEGDAAYSMRGLPMKSKINTDLLTESYRSTLWRIRKRYQVYDSKLKNFSFELKSPDELISLTRKKVIDII
jgi:predicted acylesterase/phospholipase RssA